MKDFLKRHPDSTVMKDERANFLLTMKRGAEGFSSNKQYAEAIRYYQYWLAEEPDAADAKQGLQAAQQALEKEKQEKAKKKR